MTLSLMTFQAYIKKYFINNNMRILLWLSRVNMRLTCYINSLYLLKTGAKNTYNNFWLCSTKYALVWVVVLSKLITLLSGYVYSEDAFCIMMESGSGPHRRTGLDSARAYQLTLAALDTLAKLYDDLLRRFRFAAWRCGRWSITLFYSKLFS